MTSPVNPGGITTISTPSALFVDPAGDYILMHRIYQALGCKGGCSQPVNVQSTGAGASVTQVPGNPGQWIWAESSSNAIGNCDRANPVVPCALAK
jgi:hypothetical protein